MFFGIDKTFSFSTDGNDSNIVVSKSGECKLGKVETVSVYMKENRVLILTRDTVQSDYLYGFDLEGNLIFKIIPPEHYSFWYLGEKQIACNEADSHAKKSPLSGWWFAIDLDNGNLTMGYPTY